MGFLGSHSAVNLREFQAALGRNSQTPLLLPGPKVPLAKKYLEQPTTVNMQKVVRAQKKVAAEFHRKQLVRTIALMKKRSTSKLGLDATTHTKRKAFADKRAMVMSIRERNRQGRDIERLLYQEQKDATWIRQRKHQTAQSSRGSVFSDIFGATLTKMLQESFVSETNQLSMKHMCWMVAIKQAKWGRFIELTSQIAEPLRGAAGKKKAAILRTMFNKLQNDDERSRRASSTETMSLVKLCRTNLGKRVTTRRTNKSIEILTSFLHNFAPIGINYLALTFKTFVRHVCKAQRMIARFLRNNRETAKMLDRVWQLVESGIVMHMREQELDGESASHGHGESAPHGQHLGNQQRFHKHSISAVVNSVRPKLKYDSAKHDSGIKKMIKKMQRLGTVKKVLTEKERERLCKILVPGRVTAGMAKSQIPRGDRLEALLLFLQKCRRVHQNSKESKDALKKVG
jgi:hypothetical protein